MLSTIWLPYYACNFVLGCHTADAILSFLGLLASFASSLACRLVDCHFASDLVVSADRVLDILVPSRRPPTAFAVAPVLCICFIKGVIELPIQCEFSSMQLVLELY